MAIPRQRPFSNGSVSIGLHPHAELGAVAQVDQLLCEARAADETGYDGVTVSEHHAGFPGYLPQPLTAASWILAECTRVWAAPAPTLLGLRSPRLLAEELAWSAARQPGRLGVAVAPGYAREDFDAVGASYADRLDRFPRQLDELISALSDDGPLASDAAIASGVLDTSSILLASNSTAGVARAARNRLGLLFPGGESAERLGRLTADYRAQGGTGAIVGIVVVWIGERAGNAIAEAAYRHAAAQGMRQRARFAQEPLTGHHEHVAAMLCDFVDAAGVSAINVRFRSDAARAVDVVDQIGLFAENVLSQLRAALPTPEPLV